MGEAEPGTVTLHIRVTHPAREDDSVRQVTISAAEWRQLRGKTRDDFVEGLTLAYAAQVAAAGRFDPDAITEGWVRPDGQAAWIAAGDRLGGPEVYRTREALAAVCSAFRAAGVELTAETAGRHLTRLAERTADELRAGWLTGDADFAAVTDLLTALSALTDLCGVGRTPTAVELYEQVKNEQVRDEQGETVADPFIVHVQRPADPGRPYWPSSDTRLRTLLGTVLGDARQVDAALGIVDAVVGPRLPENNPPAGEAARQAYLHAARLARDLAAPAPRSPAGPGITPEMLERMAVLLEQRAAEAAGQPDPARPPTDESTVIGVGGTLIVVPAGVSPTGAFGPCGVPFWQTVIAVSSLTDDQVSALDRARLEQNATSPRTGRGGSAAIYDCVARAYTAAVESGRWRTAADVVEQPPDAAYRVKLAALVRDLITAEDYEALIGPWVAVFGAAPGTAGKADQ
jgi:hypothetical protein